MIGIAPFCVQLQGEAPFSRLGGAAEGGETESGGAAGRVKGSQKNIRLMLDDKNAAARGT